MPSHPLRAVIDGLQYCNWSPEIFDQIARARPAAIHVTICYHENFRETVANIISWNRWFERFPDIVFHGTSGADIHRATQEKRTAIIFGLQNCSAIEDDIGLVQVLHSLGVRIMQLTYNNQSLLATGCYESSDTGLTRMGTQVVAEMNRVGMLIDMSHSGERSTLEAIDASSRPIAITHANPHVWHPAVRNKSHTVLEALTARGGMLGFSIYPHHLKGGSACPLDEFCTMIARTAEAYGTDHLAIGSDLCQGQPDSVVEWMRTGRWSKVTDFGEGSKAAAGFPAQPDWFRDNRDFGNIAGGLLQAGFSQPETDAIMGGNWLEFFDQSFAPGNTPSTASAAENNA